MAPKRESALATQRTECAGLQHVCGSGRCFTGSEWGELTPRDVRNEDRTGYMHENTGDDDKMSSEKHAFTRKCTHCTPVDRI